jgi:uncharacterized membrane protein YjgN (DUF898 family)
MLETKTPFQFTGKAGEYFGIWIVNLLLSIITLGIYSAWAKVRRLKYFYNNTLIDGVGFDYHANPIAILKGRIIAFLLFVAYTVLSKFSPLMGGLLLVALFLLTPWLIMRSMIFNARNTSHRGLRFDFSGKTGKAAVVFLAYPLLVLVTLGLAIPFVSQRSNKFLLENHQFGLSHFQSKALVKDFYMIYLKLLGVIFCSIVFFAVLGAVFSNAALGDWVSNTMSPKNLMQSIFKYGVWFFVFMAGIALFYACMILSISAYIKSRTTNLIWNHTHIEHVGFVSTQRMRDLVFLNLTSMLAIILTFGLAAPWVHVRMARYKATHLALTGDTDWDKFVGEKKESARAFGGEMVDMFDMDISFG